MYRRVELLVPGGVLSVEQVFQEVPGAGGETAGLWETGRRAELNGVPLYWTVANRDLLDAADDALRLLGEPGIQLVPA